MKKNVKKYGVMIIAAVLLVALAFAGAASAETVQQVTATEWNSWGDDVESHIVSDTIFEITGSASDIIYPKYNGSDHVQFNLTHDVTLDFSKYHGTFFGEPNALNPSSGHRGAIFGEVVNQTSLNSLTLTIKNLSMNGVIVNSSSGGVGGIIGYVWGNKTTYAKANFTNCPVIVNFTNCSLENCLVRTSGGFAGGLISCNIGAGVNFDNCKVKSSSILAQSRAAGGIVSQGHIVSYHNCEVANCSIASMSSLMAGGLAGESGNADIGDVIGCVVENSSISGSNVVGGLFGRIYNKTASVKRCEDCSVLNCIVSGYTANSANVGGLFGDVNSNSVTVSDCKIENSTIVVNGEHPNPLGGMIGTGIAYFEEPKNILKWSAIRGDNYTGSAGRVAIISGKQAISTHPNVSQESVWFNDDKNGNYPKVYVSKSDVNPGPENSDYFNAGYIGEPTGLNAKIVTHLAGYGVNGKYEAFGYVYETEPEYPITNLTVQGTVIVQNASTSAGITTAKEGDLIHVIANSNAGYHFDEWNVTNSTGQITIEADGNFTMPASPVNTGANFIVNTTTVTASDNEAEFGNENITTIRSASGNVVKVLLETVMLVENEAVVFIADNNSLDVPDLNGYTKVDDIAVFEISASVQDDHSEIFINVTFADAANATANKDKIKFSHFNTQNNAWDKTPLKILNEPEQDGASVMYVVETTSFSPFGIGIYTAIPPQYTPSSSSKQTGSTIILQEGQTAPTAYATAAPTVSPTVKPTEQPATPTVIATAKPTTQATQASPAPFLGILAGLGAAAVLLRMRK